MRRIAALLIVVGSCTACSASESHLASSPKSLEPAIGISTSAYGNTGVKSAGLRWYHDGIGSAGWIPSAAYWPGDHGRILIGSDTSGPYITDDGGKTWDSAISGLPGSDWGKANYVGGICPITAPWANYWLIATQAGIYHSDGPKATTWTRETTPADGFLYAYDWDGAGGYTYSVPDAIPFHCVDWDGASLMIAGAGWSRWNEQDAADNGNFRYYPNNVIANSPQTPAAHTIHSLWRKIHNDASGEAWRPWPGTSNWGNVLSVAVHAAAADTTVAASCKDGIMVGRYSGGSWTWVNYSTSYAWRCVGTDRTLASGWGSGSTGQYTCWNLELAADGILYATLHWFNGVGGRSSRPSTGVYAINTKSPVKWYYVGSDADVWGTESILERSEGPSCIDASSEGSQFVWMELNEGAGAAPDTLTAVDQRGTRGCIRTVVSDYTASNQTWAPLAYRIYGTPDTLYNFDLGWMAGSYASSEFVATMPGDSRYIVADFAQIQTTTNGGTSWSSSSYATQSGYSTSKGQAQGNVVCLAQLDDHRVAWGSEDNGIFVSDTSDLGNWQWVRPTLDTTYPDSSAVAADAVWRQQASDLAPYPNFQGSGREALIGCWNDDDSYNGAPGRIMAWWDSDGDGDREFTCLSAAIPYQQFVSLLSMAVAPDGAILVGYMRHGTTWSTITARGVYRLTWNGSAWVVADGVPWNSGLPTYPYVVDFAFAGGRVFAALEFHNNQDGGVYYADDDGSGSWTAAFTAPGDVRCVTANAAGTAVYAGSSGYRRTNGDGAVRRTTNPAGSPPTWTTLANASTANTFGWTRPTAITVAGGILDGYWVSDALWAEYMTWVTDVAVNPSDASDVWIGLGQTMNANFRDRAGAWRYNGSSWSRATSDLRQNGMAISSVSFIGHPARVVVGCNSVDLQVARLDGAKMSTYNRIRPPTAVPYTTDLSVDNVHVAGGVMVADIAGTNSIAGCTMLVQYRVGTGSWTAITWGTAAEAGWYGTLTTTIADPEDDATLQVQVRPVTGSGNYARIGEWILENGYYSPPLPASACLDGLTINSEAKWDAGCAAYSAVEVSITATANLGGKYIGFEISYDDGETWSTATQVGGTLRKQITGTSPATSYIQSEAVGCASSVHPTAILHYNIYDAATGGSPIYASWCGPETEIVFRIVVGGGAPTLDLASVDYDENGPGDTVRLLGAGVADVDADFRWGYYADVGDTTFGPWSLIAVVAGDTSVSIQETGDEVVDGAGYRIIAQARSDGYVTTESDTVTVSNTAVSTIAVEAKYTVKTESSATRVTVLVWDSDRELIAWATNGDATAGTNTITISNEASIVEGDTYYISFICNGGIFMDASGSWSQYGYASDVADYGSVLDSPDGEADSGGVPAIWIVDANGDLILGSNATGGNEVYSSNNRMTFDNAGCVGVAP